VIDMKKIKIAVLTLLVNAALLAQTDTVKKWNLPVGFTAQIDVVYTKVGDWNGRMDLYLPPRGRKPTPVVINIHGGGWNHGDKESQTGFSPYFKNGFAVANVEYRLTGQATAPAAVEDARCALLYLIKNAKALNIDVNKMVVAGTSAGVHLALMTGLLANDHRFDGACERADSIKVAAIIDQYGITDVWDWGYGPYIRSKSAVSWLGNKAKDSVFAASVSPVTFVHKNSPPVFIVHGNADPVVPYQQSVALKKKLDEAGVKNEFITVEGGGHGKFIPEKKTEINGRIIAFLKEIGVIGK
jgi:acetyl esterase/lipase